MKSSRKNVLCTCEKCNKPFKWYEKTDLCRECWEKEHGSENKNLYGLKPNKKSEQAIISDNKEVL